MNTIKLQCSTGLKSLLKVYGTVSKGSVSVIIPSEMGEFGETGHVMLTLEQCKELGEFFIKEWEDNK